MQSTMNAMKSWEVKRVAYIDGLKNPSEAQQLLSLLFKNQNRTEQDNKKLAVLMRAERAAERAIASRTEVAKIINAGKEDERKARNHRLIQQGLLVDFAGLEEWDAGELLGGLLTLAGMTNKQGWKQRGDALLAEKGAPAAQTSKPAYVPVQLPKTSLATS